MAALHLVARSLEDGAAMLWATLWALVLGFTISGAVQAFISRQAMQRSLGDHRARSVVTASAFGAASSSCSYAASALAKSLFARGADFTSAQAFMFASTNLVLELGIVLWRLLGWPFALAELFGSVVMIVALRLVLPRAVPATSIAAARRRLTSVEGDEANGNEAVSWRRRIRTRDGWADAAGYTVSDLTMLRRELALGFLIAGFADVAVPLWLWRDLFLGGHGTGAAIENALIGPFLAIVSFVCSVGNVPLAAALWRSGIAFGGVVAFVFADLISFPLLLIYRRYYGTAITLRLLAVFWSTMSVAGFVTAELFAAAGIEPTAPTRSRGAVAAGTFSFGHATSALDVAALLLLGGLYLLYRRHRGENTAYAKDPVCGMQVEIANAPARATVGGRTWYFCSDHCRHRFAADEHRHHEGARRRPTSDEAEQAARLTR